MNIKLLIHTMIYNFKKEFSYKIDFFGDLFSNCIFYSFQLILFSTIFSYINHLENWNKNSFYLSFLFYIFIFFSIESFNKSISDFFRMIFSGKIAPYLCCPIPLYFLIFIYFFSPAKLILSFLFLLYILYYSFQIGILHSIYEILLLILILGTLIFINLIYIFMLNFLSLFAQRELPVEYIHHEVFSLNLIPPTIYNSKVFYTLLISFPLILSAALPVYIFEFKKFEFIYYLLPLFFIMIFITKILLRKIKNYYGMFGG
ncbi:ABC-2 family transporter protein [Silvanigrella aquatica]|uniref:ABC transporter permease n=1 Tax=Silvanigrella aquatica TaxID=1915309 RepID=A0A1L4CXE5_9BACT|nr:hypothetical protein AXG55_01180 [Silvanigrella aquatica]